MITVYKKGSIPKSMELIEMNDIFFNKQTTELLDNRAKEIIFKIDQSIMHSRFIIRSKFDHTALNIDKLSTGCKKIGRAHV